MRGGFSLSGLKGRGVTGEGKDGKGRTGEGWVLSGLLAGCQASPSVGGLPLLG